MMELDLTKFGRVYNNVTVVVFEYEDRVLIQFFDMDNYGEHFQSLCVMGENLHVEVEHD